MKKLIAIFLLVFSTSLVFGQANGLVISNKASGGAIGTAAATVDVASLFNVNQTTAGQTLTVPNLTNTTNGKTIHINNVGSTAFTLLSKTIEPGTGILLRWTGSAWSISGVGNASGDGGSADSSIFATQYDISLKVDKSGTKVLSDENYSTAEKSKLSGIATGATANSSDAQLRDRSTHTGTQLKSTISDLGNSAGLNVGTTAGTVAAGDDSRFTVTDATIATTDVTTNNATSLKHGFLKKLSGSATEYMNGAGNWSTPAGGGSADSSTFVTKTYFRTTANNQLVGTLFSDPVTTTGNYTKTATSGSQTFSGSGCTMTGGNNSFTTNFMSYNYNSIGTMLENYTIKEQFVSTANSTGAYGHGIGINQSSGVALSVMMNTNSAGSRGTIYVVDANTNTLLATSSTALTYANTDSLQMEFRFSGLHLQGYVKNLTTTTRTVSGFTMPNDVTVDYDFTVTNRVGLPTIYTHGGTQVVTNLTLKTDEFQNPRIILMGDSRLTWGSCGTQYRRRWADLVGANSGQKIMVWAKGGATVATLNSAFSEISGIVKGQPAYVVAVIGINDAIIARTPTQFRSDYTTLINNIKAAGCIPIVSKIAYVGTSYASAATINAMVDSINAYINVLPYRKFDENTSTKTGSVLTSTLSCDEIHWNDLGFRTVAEAYKTQLNSLYKTTTTFTNDGTYNYTSSPTIFGGTQISTIVGGTTEYGAYFGVTTPSATNYGIKGDGTNTYINAPTGSVFIRSANSGFSGGTSLFTAVGSTGNVSVGPPVTNQRLFSINQDTGPMSLGSLVGTTSLAAIYMKSGTLSGTNYTIAGDATNTAFNAPSTTGSISFNQGGVSRGAIASTNWQFYNGTAQTSGNPTQFYFLPSANTGQTAGAGFKLFHADLAVTIQHASNTAVTTDKGFYITAPTIGFATAGGTSTDATTFEVSAPPTQGTNATLTRAWTARLLGGNTAIGGSMYVGDATGTTAPTSTLQTGGSFAATYTTTATNLTLTSAHFFVNVTATATITLPTAVGITGRIYIIKSSFGITTMASTSSQTIDGSAPGTVTGQMRVISDGANWFTF